MNKEKVYKVSFLEYSNECTKVIRYYPDKDKPDECKYMDTVDGYLLVKESDLNILREYKYGGGIKTMEYAGEMGELLPKDSTMSEKAAAYDQVKWERDCAIEQLKELGYELGQKVEKKDETEVVYIAISLVDGSIIAASDDYNKLSSILNAHSERVEVYRLPLNKDVLEDQEKYLV